MSESLEARAMEPRSSPNTRHPPLSPRQQRNPAWTEPNPQTQHPPGTFLLFITPQDSSIGPCRSVLTGERVGGKAEPCHAAPLCPSPLPARVGGDQGGSFLAISGRSIVPGLRGCSSAPVRPVPCQERLPLRRSPLPFSDYPKPHGFVCMKTAR